MGYFYISGYKPNHLAEVQSLAKEFFSKPLQEKLEIDIQKNKASHRGYGAFRSRTTEP